MSEIKLLDMFGDMRGKTISNVHDILDEWEDRGLLIEFSDGAKIQIVPNRILDEGKLCLEVDSVVFHGHNAP